MSQEVKSKHFTFIIDKTEWPNYINLVDYIKI